MSYLSILPAAPVEGAYTYEGEGAPGQIVMVPFGRQTIPGVVLESVDSPDLDRKKIKQAQMVEGFPLIRQEQLQFMQRMSDWTMIPLGQVLRQHLANASLLKRPTRKTKASIPPASKETLIYTPPKLEGEQVTAAKSLRDMVAKGGYQTCLLDGVTGSGKTEVFFEAVDEALKQNRQVVILMPEIALSNAFLKRFEARFSCAPALWHSQTTPARKRTIWQSVLDGQTRVVLGARSALFLPFQDLGLIIVDEEHDTSYKQEEGGIYHARDMAVLKAHTHDIPALLVSATPSLETLYNVSQGRYQSLQLSKRYGGAELPDVDVIDMKEAGPESGKFLSEPLIKAIASTLGQDQQAMLFLNRRGYAPLTLCRACGHRLECPQCTAWLVEHKQTGRTFCHHCGYGGRTPEACPSCGAEGSLVPIGPGVERIAEEAKEAFPDARITVLSSDMEEAGADIKETLRAIKDGDFNLIIGTQMIAKGHHFPNLSLVGVVDADLGLEGGDFRAGERTWQLLHQVAGRAGRESVKGRVLLQTYQADNRLIQTLLAQDRDAYLGQELTMRQMAGMPPFTRMAGIILSDPHEKRVEEAGRLLTRKASTLLHSDSPPSVQILGPAVPPMGMLRGRHRRRFLVIAGKDTPLQPFIRQWLADIEVPSSTKIHIDIDPQSFF